MNQFSRHSPETRSLLQDWLLKYKAAHGDFPPKEEAEKWLASREGLDAWMRDVIKIDGFDERVHALPRQRGWRHWFSRVWRTG